MRKKLLALLTICIAAMFLVSSLPIPRVSASTVATEGIINGGFETGSLPPWQAPTGGPGVTNSNPHSGSYCCCIEGNYNDYIWQTLAVQIPTSDISAIYCWARGTAGDPFAVELTYTDGSTSTAIKLVSSSWSQFDVASYLIAGKALQKIKLGIYQWHNIYFDDVSITYNRMLLDQKTFNIRAVPKDPDDGLYFMGFSGTVTAWKDGTGFLITLDDDMAVDVAGVADFWGPYAFDGGKLSTITKITCSQYGGVGSVVILNGTEAVMFECFGFAGWRVHVECRFQDYGDFQVTTLADASAGDEEDGANLVLNLRSRLYLSASSGGTTSPAPGTYTYWSGTSVSVTATPTSGYHFSYWLLDGAYYYSNPITVGMTSDHSLTAYFAHNGGGGGCVLQGTRILMADGKTKPVEAVKPGDSIMGYDVNSGTFVTETVTSNNRTKVNEIMSINKGLLYVTLTDQPIYTDHGWIKHPQDLMIGWKIYNPTTNMWTVIQSLKALEGHFSVYDLRATAPDTFIGNGILLDWKVMV